MKLRGIAPKAVPTVPTVPTAATTPNTTGAKLRAAWAAGIGLLALAVCAPQAQAQVVDTATRKPYAIRIGDYIPSENAAQRAGDTHNLAIEFDYTVQRIAERSSVAVVSLGYIERDDLRVIPFTLSQVYREPGYSFLGRGYYYGAGIGIYAVRLALPDTSGDVKGLFGVHALVGIDVSDTLFVDAKYHYPFHYDRKFFGGLQIGAGVRF